MDPSMLNRGVSKVFLAPTPITSYVPIAQIAIPTPLAMDSGSSSMAVLLDLASIELAFYFHYLDDAKCSQAWRSRRAPPC